MRLIDITPKVTRRNLLRSGGATAAAMVAMVTVTGYGDSAFNYCYGDSAFNYLIFLNCKKTA